MKEPIAYVGNLPLPATLLAALDKGRWRLPQYMEKLARIFRDEPDGPHFFDVAAMVKQNQSFQGKSQAEVAHMVPGSDGGIGVDPALAVLIGDLGADMPIALDYRTNEANPRVIYLGSEGWYEIAPDLDTLIRLLGL
jgi:hypothetical protein